MGRRIGTFRQTNAKPMANISGKKMIEDTADKWKETGQIFVEINSEYKRMQYV